MTERIIVINKELEKYYLNINTNISLFSFKLFIVGMMFNYTHYLFDGYFTEPGSVEFYIIQIINHLGFSSVVVGLFLLLIFSYRRYKNLHNLRMLNNKPVDDTSTKTKLTECNNE